MMYFFRGETLGINGLCEILRTMAQNFDRHMVLARCHDGEATSYMITPAGALTDCIPVYEPIAFAMPDGACTNVHELEHDQLPLNGSGG